jgi:hypothetical protein
VQTIEGNELTDRDMGLLERGERPVFAARPSYATVAGGPHWSAPLMLLTDRRMMISKEKLFGRPKADFAVPWTSVGTVDGQLWNGGGPKIQLLVNTDRGVIELIVPPEYASEVESAIRRGYLDAR